MKAKKKRFIRKIILCLGAIFFTGSLQTTSGGSCTTPETNSLSYTFETTCENCEGEIISHGPREPHKPADPEDKNRNAPGQSAESLNETIGTKMSGASNQTKSRSKNFTMINGIVPASSSSGTPSLSQNYSMETTTAFRANFLLTGEF